MKLLKLSFSLAAFMAVSQLHLHAQWVQQSLELNPGWNAVFLEVDPEPASCDELFANLPVESVWDFNRTPNSPQFIQDPSTLLPGDPGWLKWFAPTHPLASQRDLHLLRDGRAYLIKVSTNAQAFTWTISGKPSLRRLTWYPGGLNFVGFRVGAQAPSFQALFAGESGLAGQPVYSLDPAGHWQKVPDLATARPKPGQAYWVRCLAPAQRTAGIQIESHVTEGLVFRGANAEQSLRIRNTSSGPRTVTFAVLPSAEPPSGQPAMAGPVPLEYHHADYARTNFSWKPLTESVQLANLAPNQEWQVRLGARMNAAIAAGSAYQSILQVTDDLGTRWQIPIAAYPVETLPDAPGSRTALLNTSPFAGLWVGEAILNAVSQPARPADPDTPRPSGGEFAFRLIVHVDSEGKAHLLQKAYLVRKPPVLEPDPEDPQVSRIVEPARTVVATEESLIPGIIGEGDIIGRRVSSPAFGFRQPIELTNGTFATGALTATISLDYDDPVNPFVHRYHPDHNNLDDRYEEKLPEGHESFSVQRAITFQFTGTDPLGLNPPSWGHTEVGGAYTESVTGLHRSGIKVAGTFRLVRIAETPALNQ